MATKKKIEHDRQLNTKGNWTGVESVGDYNETGEMIQQETFEGETFTNFIILQPPAKVFSTKV